MSAVLEPPAVLELPGVAQNEAASTVVDQLEPAVQRALVAQVLKLWTHSPPARPHAIGGKAMHVKVSSAGRLAWWGDGKSYRYLPRQPGWAALPPIPPEWVKLWRRYTGRDDAPDTALVGSFAADERDASLGWHAERTEQVLELPIVTVNLGRVQWAVRQQERAPVSRCTLEPGAVVVLDGPTRLLELSIERLLEQDEQLELGVAPPPPPPFAPYPSPLPAGVAGLFVSLRIAGDPAAAAVELEPPKATPLTYEQLKQLTAQAMAQLDKGSPRRG